MGRGDQRTRKGKIFAKSHGKTRPGGKKKAAKTAPAAPRRRQVAVPRPRASFRGRPAQRLIPRRRSAAWASLSRFSARTDAASPGRIELLAVVAPEPLPAFRQTPNSAQPRPSRFCGALRAASACRKASTASAKRPRLSWADPTSPQ